MDDDWDLHAVVRGCAAASSTTTTISTSTSEPLPGFPSGSSPSFHEDQTSFDFPGLIEDRSNENPFHGLQEIYQQICVDPPPPTATTVAATVSTPAGHVFQPHQEIGQLQPPLIQMNLQNQESVQFVNPILGSSSHNFPAINPQPIRPRRRKNQQMKMVRQMTQEELSTDSWAWRKYGQKPIKGSPYPRNYYRCSTSKGCAARKQVERSPNDPDIFVVSYTGEHTHPRPAHRSSLAGSTRSKFSSSPSAAATAAAGGAAKTNNKNNALLLQKVSSFSPTTPLVEGEAGVQNDDVEMADVEDGGARDEDEENIIMMTNDLINDDEEMFKGFQDSDQSSGGGDLLPSGLLSSPPWTPTSSAANASEGGGGGG